LKEHFYIKNILIYVLLSKKSMYLLIFTRSYNNKRMKVITALPHSPK